MEWSLELAIVMKLGRDNLGLRPSMLKNKKINILTWFHLIKNSSQFKNLILDLKSIIIMKFKQINLGFWPV